jgi:hypothetical protein
VRQENYYPTLRTAGIFVLAADHRLIAQSLRRARCGLNTVAGLAIAVRNSAATVDATLLPSARMRKKPEPIHYQIRRAIMADPTLFSTAKLVASVLLLDFLNVKTGQCNPSFDAIAKRIGRCRKTVINAIKELSSGHDPWLIVKSTKGGSKETTNSGSKVRVQFTAPVKKAAPVQKMSGRVKQTAPKG